MDSTPPPIPTSICPPLMALAMIETAVKPELHYLFTPIVVVSIPIPARSWAYLAVIEPAPPCKQFPIQIS